MLEIRHPRITNSDASQTAYNDIYKDKGILLRDSFYLWIIHLLNAEPHKILMDISCGEGRLPLLAQRMGLNAIGVDFAEEGIRKGQISSKNIEWVVGDGERLPFSDSIADYITHIGSLEHYISPGQGAREIARILRPSGRACILLPNAFGLLGNIRKVWITGEIHDDGQPLQRYGTRRTWERMLIDAGLRIENTLGYGEVEFPRTRQDVVWYLKRPIKIIRFVVTKFIPLNLINQIVYICSKV